MKFFLLLVFSSFCASYNFCPPRHYWNKSIGECLECEICQITLIRCTVKTNTICGKVHETNHHFQKYRIHFFDDTDDEELDKDIHSKNFINHDELYIPYEKEHHKKDMKHSKSKHEEKHHHKIKKHFEFNNDEDDDESDISDKSIDYDTFEKPKKHKKHYEFNKHNKNHDYFSSKELNDNHHSTFGKGWKSNNHKVTHLKKVNSDEEKLEEWLIQSKKKLKLRKDDLLKTLKEENGKSNIDKKTVHLNSPIYESEDRDSNVKMIDKINNDSNGIDVYLIKEFSKDEKESLIVKDKESSYRPANPSHRLYLGEPSTVSEIIGQVKDPQDVIRDEMGKNVVFEKPRFNVIPFLSSKEPRTGGDVVSLPFTAAETLVWDWQAVAVVSAVVSCLVFFSVVAIYFVVNARQWKKINTNYNKEIEEMSTRIALMHPAIESANSGSHTTSLYLENITAHGKEDDQKASEQIK